LTSWGSSRVGVWTSNKGAGPAKEEESGAWETVAEEETQSVRRKTEASGLELDQVTVGAVEVERDSKEAETGGQEKRGSKQVATEKGGGSKADKTSSTTADREKVGEKKR